MENTTVKTGMPLWGKILITLTILTGVAVGGYFGYTKLIKKPDGTPNTPPDNKDGNTKNNAGDKGTDTKSESDKVSADTDTVKSSGGGGSKTPAREPVNSKPSGGGGGGGTGGFGGNASSLGVTRNTKVAKGTKGAAATFAQRALNQLGAALEADGIFGTKSEAALLKITGKKSITLGALADFAKGKGKDNVFGIQLY